MSRVVAVAVALICAAAGLTACSTGSGAGPDAPSALTVDGLRAPIGLGVSDVAFAWDVDDTRRGAMESAYRLTVSNGKSKVWDSGRVQSTATAFGSC